MKNIIFLDLVISLTLIVCLFLPLEFKKRKTIRYIAGFSYILFLSLSIVYGTSVKDAEKQVKVKNVKMTLPQNKELVNSEKSDQPIVISWEAEEEIVVNKPFILNIKVTNNSKEDIDILRLKFNNRLQERFSISGVTPEVSINGDVISLGSLPKEETIKFDFELVPKSKGAYEAVVIPLVDKEAMLVNGKEISSKLKLDITGGN